MYIIIFVNNYLFLKKYLNKIVNNILLSLDLECSPLKVAKAGFPLQYVLTDIDVERSVAPA